MYKYDLQTLTELSNKFSSMSRQMVDANRNQIMNEVDHTRFNTIIEVWNIVLKMMGEKE